MDMGGTPPPMDNTPLSESKKDKILSTLGDDDKISDLFDMNKAQRNIYEIENKLKDILND